MIKKSLKYIILFLICTVHLYSLDNPKLGFYGNLNYNIYSTDFTNLPGIPNCCPKFITGLGKGFNFGGIFQFELSPKSDFIFKLGINDRSALLTNIEQELLNFDGTAINGEFEHRLDIELIDLRTEFLVQSEFYGIKPIFGFGIGYNIKESVDQVEEIIKPSDRGVFVDTGKRTRNKFTGSIPEIQTLSASLIVGLMYELPLNQSASAILSPFIRYEYGLTNVISDYDWSVNSINFGARVLFNLSGENRTIKKPIIEKKLQETELIAVEKLDTTPIPKFEITDLTGKTVKNIRIEEFLSTNMKPLLNYLFFDNNSNELQDVYRTMNVNEVNTFNLKSLANSSALETYYDILNIVGFRMQNNPESKIEVVGCNSNLDDEKNNLELSKIRANSVQSYLVDKWKITPNRIKTTARNLPEENSSNDTKDGNAENRRVEIYSNLSEILDPIITNDTIVSFDRNIIKIEFNNFSEFDYDRIEVRVEQNNHILTNQIFYSKDTILLDLKSLDRDYLESGNTEIYVKLVLDDSLGYEAKIGTIYIDFANIESKQQQRMLDKRVDKFSLILFKFDKYILDERNVRISDLIKENIKDNSTVKIYGYTDRMGDADYNIQLSERRASEVAKQLGFDRSAARGIGEKIEFYPNNIPEGRFYSRTVEVIIETPIQWK